MLLSTPASRPPTAFASLRQAADTLFHRDSHTIRCRQPDEASAQLRSVYSHHHLRLLGTQAHFDMRLHLVRAGRLELGALGFGTEVELKQQPPGRFTLVTTQLSGHSEIHTRGERHGGGGGMVVLDSAGQAVTKRFSADSCRINLRVDQAVLESKCAELLGRDVGGALVFHPALPAGTPAQLRWTAWLQMLLGCLDRGEADTRPCNPLLLRQIEEAGLLLLLTEIPHNRSALLATPEPEIAPRHVRRAEEFIRSHAAEALTLGDIAAAAGVSIRALTDGFRRARNTTPMIFLREQRLLGARAELQQADAVDTVTAIALRWGFGNPGRFAADYRRRFGESPSATMRRAA